jgi:hypothetical protein
MIKRAVTKLTAEESDVHPAEIQATASRISNFSLSNLAQIKLDEQIKHLADSNERMRVETLRN